MQLSAPIYQLKRKAKTLVRENAIPLHMALDRVAMAEGYASWSLLAARYVPASAAARLYGRLREGDLLLLGARPGQGKTMLALELAVEAMRRGRQGRFFTLEYTQSDVLNRLGMIGVKPEDFGDLFECDCSDRVCADYIIEKAGRLAPGALIVIDYLQLLDQRRENAPLDGQVAALKAFAQRRGVVVVFIAQIDRSYDAAIRPCPELSDLRMPNRLDVSAFDKTCFLHGGDVRMAALG
ncbi:MAG: DNA helicase [Pelagibacterium sp. SCN 64-44]|nr:MAG: DNA helicase [Pelagibacterium sp. SCN 64-44]